MITVRQLLEYRGPFSGMKTRWIPETVKTIAKEIGVRLTSPRLPGRKRVLPKRQPETARELYYRVTKSTPPAGMSDSALRRAVRDYRLLRRQPK